MQKHYLLIVCICALLFTGCGKQVSVKGKVAFPDGEPLTRGTVQFRTLTFVASGEIQSDGSYVVGSLKQDDGLPKGTYTVTVSAYGEPEKAASGDPLDAKPAKSLIDLKYSSPDTSPLKCDVQGSMVFPITVEPFKE